METNIVKGLVHGRKKIKGGSGGGGGRRERWGLLCNGAKEA